MNKKLLLVALGIFLLITAGAVYLLLQKPTVPEAIDKTNTENMEERPSVESDVPDAKGAYLDYTEASFATAKGTKLLFFHASWCPQCRDLDESIRMSELPGGVTIFKVDYDSNQALRAKYGVTLQTTVIKTDEAGNKVDSYVAYKEPNYQSVKRALLP